jgi:endonuclease/exonuclease/phosphatase family metal-dependent hydrolase
LHGRSLEDGQVDVDRLADSVRALDADVVGLQEVDRDQPRSAGADLTAVAASAMGAVDHRFVAALAGRPDTTWQAATGAEQPGTATYGIALLSRYPVHGWRVVRLPPLRIPVPLWHRSWRPDVVRDEARVAVIGTARTPLGDICVANTHVSFLPAWNAVQLRRLMRVLAASSGPTVLMGDLNMRPAAAQRLTGLRPLASAPTYPADGPTRQIDHILARGLALDASGRAEHTEISDHRALLVDLDQGGTPLTS